MDPRRSSRAFWCIGYVMSNNSNISHFSSITLFYLFCESVLKHSFISLFAFPFDFLKGTAVFKVFELYSSPTKVYASVLYINCSVYVSGCGSTSSLGIFLLFLKKKFYLRSALGWRIRSIDIIVKNLNHDLLKPGAFFFWTSKKLCYHQQASKFNKLEIKLTYS